MKNNLSDIIIDKLKERRDLVRNKLTEQYKGVKPFRMTPASDDELLGIYNQMTPEKMSELVAQQGEEKVNQYIEDMETLKRRKLVYG